MAVELSPELRTRFDAILAKYPGHKEAALLPVLHLVQDEFGHLSIDLQALVARELGVSPVRVHEVTTFYEMFHEHPEGQFHFELCTNIACHLCGGDTILDHVKKRLGIEVGHHTEDGLFSLMEAECLASCGSGPTMRVGADYYENLTTDAVDALISNFKKLAPGLEGRPYLGAEGEPHVGPVPGFEPPQPSPAAAETGARSDNGAAASDAEDGENQDSSSDESKEDAPVAT